MVPSHYFAGMHEYDIALKSILTRRSASLITRLTGLEVSRWHNSELPDVRTRRADLLGETLDGQLVHVELQSTNDREMGLRMLDYSAAIRRGFGSFPVQMVLYVGKAPVRMERTLAGPGITFGYSLVDIRELDSESLLESRNLDDNVLAILGRLSDEIDAVRRILAKIADSEPSLRARALAELVILAGLRHLGGIIEKESERMPILDDIMDHEVIGRERKAGIVIGREEGEREVILTQIAQRFGPLPPSLKQRIDGFAKPELDRIALRLLKASSVEELLG